MSKTILVIEDDHEQAIIVRHYLEDAEYDVFISHDGSSGLKLFRENPPDLVVLDVMLPGMNGLDICREIRREKKDTPIIMVTALGSEESTLAGFEVGVDDYLSKPYRPRELVARIGSLIRRYENKEERSPTMGIPGLEIDILKHEVKVDGVEVALSVREFELLIILVAQPGRVYSRDQLLENAFGFDYQGLDRTVDAHVGNLREKIGDNPKKPRFIETVYGVGYRVINA